MIVSGGRECFPKEVEDCLALNDSVTEVAAIGVDDDQFGKRLRAFVVLSHSSCTEDHLKDWVKENLARYKVPREIVFLDELPRNATGKRRSVSWWSGTPSDRTDPRGSRT